MPGDNWMVTTDEALDMFARQFEARYRSGAVERARQRANSLKSKGDHEGTKLWVDVAARVEALRSHNRVAIRRAVEQT